MTENCQVLFETPEMTSAKKIIALLQSYGELDEDKLYATAMQIATAEAEKEHADLAQELKTLIEKAKSQKELSGLWEVFQPNVRLKDIVLDKPTKDSLTRIVTEQQKFDLLVQHNLTPRRKILLVGTSGCGKTMTAKALAGELQIPLYVINVNNLLSKDREDAVEKMKTVFGSIKQHRAVYLFDEFEPTSLKRHYRNDATIQKHLLNSFLLQIEKDNSYNLLIVATNQPKSLDKTLYRKFDDVIKYPLPNRKEIIALIKTHLKGYILTDINNLLTLAEEAVGLSYADISNACEDAIKEMIIANKNKVSSRSLLQCILYRKQGF